MVGCVSGAGRLGIDPEPAGGARFIAGPVVTSGTTAGGTGGGRSENIWAATEPGTEPARIVASAISGKSRPARPHPPIPLPVDPMGHAFHLKRGKFKPCSGRNAPAAVGAFWNVAER